MPSEKSCGIVVFREELPERLYLLLHYAHGHWDFPKGHIEPRETEIQAASREALEETGLEDIELVFGFRKRIEYAYRKGRKTMHKEVFFFLGRTGESTVRLSSEHVGFEWLTYEKALAQLTYDTARGVLRDAQNALAEWGVAVPGKDGK